MLHSTCVNKKKYLLTSVNRDFYNRVFRRMDDDGSHSLNEEEFAKGVTETGLEVTDEETKELFKAFDADGTGTIDFNEFLKAIRVSIRVSLNGPIHTKFSC